MTIPEPVASTACAEETSLMCGRKERKRGGGACSIQSRGQHKAKPPGPDLPLGCWSLEENGRAAAALPTPRAAGSCVQGFPSHPDQSGQPSALLPSPSRTGRTGSSQSPGQRRREGQGTRRQAPRFLSPPLSHSLGAGPGAGWSGQPARGRVGRAAPASPRTWC